MLKTVGPTIAAAAVVMMCGVAHASELRSVDIPPGELAPALEALARETGLELIFQPHELKGLRTAGVKGHLSPKDAVHVLIRGTGLTIKVDPAGAILITAPSDATAPAKSTPPNAAQESRTELSSATPVSLWERGRLARATSRSGVGWSSSDSGSTYVPVEEITVTADRVGEKRLQDVPISISVLSTEELDRSTSSNLFDSLSRVPGVVISEHLVGGAQVPIRGVAASTAVLAGSSPTAFYFDGVPFGFVRSAVGPNPNTYDLERVEVLRGPQGTLYGASALNGVVRILTRDADLEDFELKSRIATSTTKGGGENYRGDLAVNAPIFEDRFAVRAVLGYQNWSGWIDKPDRENANDAEMRDARVRLRAAPTGQLSLGLHAWFSRHDWGAPALAEDGNHQPSARRTPIGTEFDLYGFTIGYEASGFSIVGVSSYIDYASDSMVDLMPAIPPPDPGVVVHSIFENETFAQELILHSTGAGNWRWSIGGIYRDSADVVYQNFPGISPVPVVAGETSESYAVFGQLTRVFGDGDWELTAGLRYFEDRYGSAVSSPVVVSGRTTRFHATTPRVVLSWHPRRELTLYGSYSEGFRSGLDQSFLALSVAPFLPPLEPDSLRNYELGVKGTVLGGRLSFDTALYFIDWQDVQQDTIVAFVGEGGFERSTSALLNGESASGAGFDLGVTARPTSRLELGATFSWNDVTMDSDVYSGGLLVFQDGERLNFSSEYTAGAFADYSFPLRNGFAGRLSVSANYTSGETHKQVTAASFAGGQVLAIPGDDLLISRASFSIHSPQNWTASLFVDNLNNEDGSPHRSPAEQPWFARRITPRVVGLQVQYQRSGG